MTYVLFLHDQVEIDTIVHDVDHFIQSCVMCVSRNVIVLIYIQYKGSRWWIIIFFGSLNGGTLRKK